MTIKPKGSPRMADEGSNAGRASKWIVTPALYDELKRFENLYGVLKDKPMMILGASGVGKSLFVHIFERLYREEHGKGSNIQRLNCAAFDENLLLSELFGHVRGAFTGAVKDKPGHIEKANGGVLILEEVGELPKHGQAQLLTFIEDGIYYKVGSTEPEFANVRIVATTNKPKEAFREDFWYRFFPFLVPPLYKRRGDILYYFAHMFPELISLLMPWEVLTLLCYNWPGNVRELERVGRLLAWKKENQKGSFRQTDKYTWLDHILYSALRGTDDYTLLEPHEASFLHHSLEDFGVDINALDSVLGEFGLSLAPQKNRVPAFPDFDSYERMQDEDIENRYGVQTLFGTAAFDEAYTGLGFFCKLFMQVPFFDKNLLDVETGDRTIPIHSAILFVKKPTSTHFKVEKEIFEFLHGKRLPKNIKRLPEPSTPEYDQLMLSLDQPDTKGSEMEIIRKTIADMSGAELEKLHNEALMERTNGNISKAATLKGISRTAFEARLKKYGA
jgi:transcriptional regulator with AAA-type ATPase domain